MVYDMDAVIFSLSSITNREAIVHCPLCNAKTQSLHCTDCLNSGNFYHSKSIQLPDKDRYVDKSVDVVRHQGRMKLLAQQVKEMNDVKQKAYMMEQVVQQQRMKNIRLQRAAADLRKKLASLKEEWHAADKSMKSKSRINDRYKRSMASSREILQSAKTKAALNDKETHDTKSRVSLLNSALCDDLLTYILPLRCLEDSGSGRQAHSHMLPPTEDSLCFIDETVPVYSICDLPLLSAPKLITTLPTELMLSDPMALATCPLGPEAARFCSVLNSTAALTFLTQLVNILAGLKEITLPHYLSHGELNEHDMSDDTLMHLVTKLNINVAVFCASVGVPLAQIKLQNGLMHNVLLLLQTFHERTNVEKCSVNFSEESYQLMSRISVPAHNRSKNYVPYINSIQLESAELHLLNDYDVVLTCELDCSS